MKFLFDDLGVSPEEFSELIGGKPQARQIRNWFGMKQLPDWVLPMVSDAFVIPLGDLRDAMEGRAPLSRGYRERLNWRVRRGQVDRGTAPDTYPTSEGSAESNAQTDSAADSLRAFVGLPMQDTEAALKSLDDYTLRLLNTIIRRELDRRFPPQAGPRDDPGAAFGNPKKPKPKDGSGSKAG